MIDKAFTLAPDGLTFDLEDAVPPAMKDTARAMVAEAIRRPKGATSQARLVRVNGGPTGRMEDDVRAIVHPNLDGIVMPKVEDVAEIEHLDAFLSRLEPEHGIPSRAI